MSENKWMDIETAPTDGTAVLCFWPGFDPSNADGRNFGVAMFADGEWRSPDAQDDDEAYSWPTHWQPLPAPPEAA